MRKLVITQNITVDGAVEMLGDWFDPQLADEDLVAESHRQDAEADALLVGRQTFEDFRSYWPKQTEDPTGITAYLNEVAKYVVSSTMSDPGWKNSTVLTGDPVEQTKKLKSRPGKDIVLTGSISLAHALIAARLVDEYRLFVYPDGAGRRTSAIPRRRRVSETGVGRTAQGIHVGCHPAALPRRITINQTQPAEYGGTMRCGQRTPGGGRALGRRPRRDGSPTAGP